jgi:hypothetical protein
MVLTRSREGTPLLTACARFVAPDPSFSDYGLLSSVSQLGKGAAPQRWAGFREAPYRILGTCDDDIVCSTLHTNFTSPSRLVEALHILVSHDSVLTLSC